MPDSEQDLSRERFGFTVFLSICAHAIIILGVGFSYLEEISSEGTLAITMAQYRSEFAPDDADFLAQENQLGSGNLNEKAAPSSPFESDFYEELIQEVRPVPAAPMTVNDVKVQDTAVISSFQDEDQVRQQLDEVKDERILSERSTPEGLSLAIASLQAQLDLQRQRYAKRPKRYTISSASTRKSQDALYLDRWRRRIEAVGNINYPSEARRRQLYGSLRMLVALLPNGEVESIRILQPSGHSILDQVAVEIVNLAAPFQPFPSELLAVADILEIIRTWRFHEGNALTSF
ncbi:MAG TPA: energy transducer TonB [Gammaproteobacteria bacterium]|jgi:protein TonB|nr:energy transducer TonB [Gammaproteobacteria bacterium]HIL62367.1 energy transducer TonB [Porticoccaceae bacterium]|tara:strand:+ start:7065 stop:7934 length:870 start_codon:yes stop_codon:yes gene_type:complete